MIRRLSFSSRAFGTLREYSWKDATAFSLASLAAHGNHLTPETSRMLLQDVSIRLAAQHKTVTHLIDSLADHSPQESSTGGIIKATHGSVSKFTQLDHWKRPQQEEQIVKDAERALDNLGRLHADTFDLTHDLLIQSPQVFERFSSADQHLIFATMEQVRSRHASTIEVLADIVLGLQSTEKHLPTLLLHSFLRGRLAVQLLCDHGVSLSKGKQGGGISVDCNLLDDHVIEDAITEAKHMCDAHYQASPSAEMETTTPATQPVSLVRPWVHHALVEVLKNAMASCIGSEKRHKDSATIFVTAQNTDDGNVLVEIRDRGSGLTDEQAIKRAFEFCSSSINKRWDRLDEQQSYAMVRSPLQSLGVGLPLSRHMMEYFGGSLDLRNNDGPDGGCTASLLLKRDSTILEQLPLDIDVPIT